MVATIMALPSQNISHASPTIITVPVFGLWPSEEELAGPSRAWDHFHGLIEEKNNAFATKQVLGSPI